MYKFLLCWRYLRTRYIALASIVSVTLGVATMIVVNSVMSGFTTEMQDRIHGILSDVVVESRGLEGFPDPQWHMEQIRKAAGSSIDGMTATVVVPAMLSFQVGDAWIPRQVQLIGIDEKTQSQVSDFSRYLQHPDNRRAMSFQLHDTGYDTRDHQAGNDGADRPQMAEAGWTRRRVMAEARALEEAMRQADAKRQAATLQQANAADSLQSSRDATGPRSAAAGPPPWLEGPAPAAQEAAGANVQQPGMAPIDPFAIRQVEENVFDPAKEQHTGLVMGIALASYRVANQPGRGKAKYVDRFLILPGDDVKLTFPTAGMPPKPITDDFTIVDFYESKMSEYDASFVFVPIRKLQELRGMIDPATGVGYVNSIQIKLKAGADGDAVRDRLRRVFSRDLYIVSTWQDKQGALLAAVHMETAILNVLLFLIIAVAGFGILAIFFMIVVEKTRDIGILKSLGASGVGIMGIFLAYGLSLGVVGSGAGMFLGLLFVRHINWIADRLAALTGHPVFDPEIYYFYKIPVIVSPWTVGWIVAGALGIAVLASVLPACRAARLHPVEALRYE